MLLADSPDQRVAEPAELAGAAKVVEQALERLPEAAGKALPGRLERQARRPAAARSRPSGRRRPPDPPRAPESSNGRTLSKGEMAVLTAVAQRGSDGATAAFLTVATGYKRSSRDTYLSRLRRAGLVEKQGSVHAVTPAGIEALGDEFTPLPTGPDLLAHYLETLPAGERKVLQALADLSGWRSRQEISEVTDYKRSSRDTYLSRLKARGLVVIDAGEVKLAQELE